MRKGMVLFAGWGHPAYNRVDSRSFACPRFRSGQGFAGDPLLSSLLALLALREALLIHIEKKMAHATSQGRKATSADEKRGA